MTIQGGPECTEEFSNGGLCMSICARKKFRTCSIYAHFKHIYSYSGSSNDHTEYYSVCSAGFQCLKIPKFFCVHETFCCFGNSIPYIQNVFEREAVPMYHLKHTCNSKQYWGASKCSVKIFEKNVVLVQWNSHHIVRIVGWLCVWCSCLQKKHSQFSSTWASAE